MFRAYFGSGISRPSAVAAFDLQVLGEMAFAAENLDEHLGFVLELHDLAAFLVVQVGRHLVGHA